MRNSQNLDALLAKALDLSVPSSHRLYNLQQQLVAFAKPFEARGVELLTSFFHNDDATCSFHWTDESYVFVVCLDQEKPSIEISKLLDADSLSYQVLETIPFSWEELASKLNEYLAIC